MCKLVSGRMSPIIIEDFGCGFVKARMSVRLSITLQLAIRKQAQ